MTSVTAPARSARLLPAVAIVTTVALWASTFVGIRAIGPSWSPGAITFGRMLVGAGALTVFIAVKSVRRRRLPVLPRGRVLLGVLAWGADWFGLYSLALNTAERHLDAGTAALLVNLAPAIVAVLAGLLLHEGFPRRRTVGIAVAFAGVLMIAARPHSGDLAGVLLGLAAAVLYAGGAVSQKRLLASVDPLTMTWLGALAGLVMSAPFLPQAARSLQSAPVGATATIAYIGLLPTAVAFLTWGYALSRMSAGRLASTTYAVPTLVIALSGVVLHEVPSPLALGGGAVCLLGVAVATGALRRPVRRVSAGPVAAGDDHRSSASDRPTAHDAAPQHGAKSLV